MESSTKMSPPVPECGHSECIRQAEYRIRLRCPNDPPEPSFSPVRSSPTPLSDLQIAQGQVQLLVREREELRCMVAKLSTEIHAVAGQKRKESSDAPTQDPRKRPRILSPKEQLSGKIALQQQRISELEGDLFKAAEESKAKRKSDELELFNLRTCLKDLIDKAEVNHELIRKLEADAEVKEKAGSVALDAKTKEVSSATAEISRLTSRVEYLEHDRKYLKSDVTRYRAKICHLQT
ncbi:hypothetical protein B0H19DRAFT_1342157 [Mycena capillaripes]|nr:hypothetical protein B0H19DRAFT_1342157 [Mycena capillaripes]